MGSIAERKERGWGAAIAFAVVAIPLVTVLYVLSAGPMDALWNNGVITGDWVEGFMFWFYVPLRWAGECYKPIGEWTVRYSVWCTGLGH